jgi:hypothetical protein
MKISVKFNNSIDASMLLNRDLWGTGTTHVLCFVCFVCATTHNIVTQYGVIQIYNSLLYVRR